MATMKYIGARYMPKFMGTYDPTTVYEALSVVDNGAGTTYVANKPVPAGTALTNTNYWSVYGASSGAILDLQTRMGQAENDIGGLQGDIVTVNGRIDAANTKIENYSNRRFLVIGDSYLYGYNQSDPSTPIKSWGDYFADYLELTLNDDYFKLGIDGGGFISNGQVSHKWLDQLILFEPSITDHNTISDIILCGGQNDKSNNQAAVETAMAAFIAHCKGEFPNARIHIGFVGVDYLSINTQYNAIEMIGVYKKCAKYGACYMGGSEFVLRDTSILQADHCHPTADGQQTLANFVANFIGRNMNSGIENVRSVVQHPAFTPDTGVTGSLTFEVSRDNGTTFVDMFFGQGFTMTSASQTWNGKAGVKLGTIADGMLWGFTKSNRYNAPSGAIIQAIIKVDNTWYLASGVLVIQAKSIFFYPIICNSSSGYATGVISIILPMETNKAVFNTLLS